MTNACHNIFLAQNLRHKSLVCTFAPVNFIPRKRNKNRKDKIMKKLYRSNIDKRLCGVCGGIAEYFELDPTIIRLIWVLLTFCSFGTALLAYFICALIVPPQP